ncbi:MAG: ABC transporter permease [Methylohalobius sp.]|nr:ABC transporter permease [Methylohalobius sp.]
MSSQAVSSKLNAKWLAWPTPQQALEKLIVPFLSILAFVGLWAAIAQKIHTQLGAFPGPSQVLDQAAALLEEHMTERQRERDFYHRLKVRLAQAQAEGVPAAEIERLKARKYPGRPTFVDQIQTSLKTVATGFLLASMLAIPLGVLIGQSRILYLALNPLIQVFRPVSPLAWLPLVTLIVSALYTASDPVFSKAYLTSSITVALCCLWPTLINTAVGVSSVSRDLLNVSRVLRLGAWTRTTKIVLPWAIPMIFTGLRISLGIGWMVLIASEMLAQNPGLGKFVWDEFQNGSSDSLARILVAVFTIGIIGFGLDRLMLLLQKRVNWDKHAVLR